MRRLGCSKRRLGGGVWPERRTAAELGLWGGSGAREANGEAVEEARRWRKREAVEEARRWRRHGGGGGAPVDDRAAAAAEGAADDDRRRRGRRGRGSADDRGRKEVENKSE